MFGVQRTKWAVAVSLLAMLMPGCGVDELGDGLTGAGRGLPDILSARIIGSETILIEFVEPAGEMAAEPSNYDVRDAEQQPMLVNDVALSEGGMKATLTTGQLDRESEYTVAGVSQGISIPVETIAPPRVVGALSTANNVVQVTFSSLMRRGAEDPANYFIVQESSNPEAGVLRVTSAQFGDTKDIVMLQTFAQNEVNYTLRVVNVRDEFDQQMAPPELLVDPSIATFRGTPPTCEFACSGDGSACNSDDDCTDGSTCICSTQDTDGDGLPDHVEQRGWPVTVELTNRDGVFDRRGSQERDVTSDPTVADTDGDGIDDFTERELATDPRNPDTDGDGINDEREFNLFFSNPIDQDSDEDQLDDYLEVSLYKTSPILADTDGDGLDDDVEILELNRDPRVADLPEWNIELGDIRLQIDERYTYVDESGETVTNVSETTQNYERADATERLDFNSRISRRGIEAGFDAEFGKGISPKFNIFAKGFFNRDVYKGFNLTTTRSFQDSYENSLTKGREFTTTRTVEREVFGASVSAPLTIESTGDIAFSISNLELSVLQLDRTRTGYVPVATLVPTSELLTGEDTVLNLGPLVPERGPINLENQEVFPSLIEQLLRSPQGPTIVPANFDVIDEFGRNFSFASQEANDRTATLEFDFGDGTLERYNVAIAGAIDDKGFVGLEGEFVGGFDAEGSSSGIPMDYALQDILGWEKNPSTPDAIAAGEDGVAGTVALGDDVQETPVGTAGLNDRTVVVSAGENGVLETMPNASSDDFEIITRGYSTSPTCNAFTIDRIIEPPDNGDGIVSTEAVGDDIQVVPVDASVSPETVIISAGPNGIIDTVPTGDEVRRGPGDLCDDDLDCPGHMENICVFASQMQPQNLPCANSDDCVGIGFCSQNACLSDGSPCSVNADCAVQGFCAAGEAACDGREVLSRIRNSSNIGGNRAWVALVDQDLPVGTRFGDITLRPRMNLTAGFVQDLDRDGLFARFEHAFGTSDRDKDSDGDGLFDFAEIREGWDVQVTGLDIRRVYPDPRLEDSDGDGLTDPEEMGLGTDPRKRDTDGDGISDFDELNAVDFAAADCPSLSTRTCVFSNGSVDRPCTSDPECLLTLGNCSSGCPAGSSCTFGICFESGTCEVATNSELLDPLNPDTDGDGVEDGIECELGSDPVDGDDADEFRDVDEDGLTDAEEIDGWIVEIEQCDNTCPAAYDGFCQENTIACTGGPDLGQSCSNDADCGNARCRQAVGSCSETGASCSSNSDCSGTCEGGDIIPLGICSNGVNGPALGLCTSNAHCNQSCVGAVQTCVDSVNNGALCNSDNDCIQPTCGVACDTGTDCADCGPTFASSIKTSDPTLPDSDFDGLPDRVERDRGSDPTSTDTDGDGLLDFDEFSEFGSFFPLAEQFDGFFLTDAGSARYGTSLTSQDTDGDGLLDGFELFNGWRVFGVTDDLARNVFTDPLLADTDLDGLSDSREYAGVDGKPQGFAGDTGDATDPTDPDTDDDGRIDGDEVDESNPSNPLVPDIAFSFAFNGSMILEGPEDAGNNENEWIASLRIRVPTRDQVFPIFDTSDLCNDSCTGSCDSGWVTRNVTQVSIREVIDFSLDAGEPIVIDVSIVEHSGCNQTGSCAMISETTILPGDLLGAQDFVLHTVDLSDGECNAVLTFEIER